MTKRIRNLFVAILSCLLVAVVCVGMVSLVKADVTVITMTGTAEANVKTAEKSGLKFSAVIDKNEYQTLTQDKEAKVGMIIVPTDHLNAAISQGLDFTIEKLSAYAPFEGYAFYDYAETVKDNGDEYQFWMTVPNISGSNYNRDFSARAFIELTDGNSVSRVYADYDEENARNVYEVAYSAYTDGAIEDQTGKEIAKTFIDGVAVLEYDSNSGKVVIANNKGDYTSPYIIEKDGLGNYVLGANGNTPLALTYNESRYADLTLKDTTNNVTVNRIVSQYADFGENNSVSLQSAQTGGNATKGAISAISNALGYVAINGEYGVGTYITTTFKGNNMPQVMFFSNVIDGDLTGVAYTDETRQGIIAMNGIVGDYTNETKYHDTDIWRVYGPKRLSGSGYTVTNYQRKAELSGEGYELLTQDGLRADTSDITYRYTVGTYLNDEGKIMYEVFLYNNDTNELIVHEEILLSGSGGGAAYLTEDSVTPGNIILYASVKGTKDLFVTDFTYSMPFSRDKLLEGIQTQGVAEYNDSFDMATLVGVRPVNSQGTKGVGAVGTIGVEDSYIAFEGNYGVGYYVEFIFTGNNMPYINLFTDTIDGYLGTPNSDGTNGKGVVIINGIVDQGNQRVDDTINREIRCGEYNVWGPNRYTTTNQNGSNYTSKGFVPVASLSYNNYPLLTQQGLKEDTSGTMYNYRVGTYYDESGEVVLDVVLSNAITKEIIYDIDQVLTGCKEVEAGNIIALAPMKGLGKNSTFKFKKPVYVGQ